MYNKRLVGENIPDEVTVTRTATRTPTKGGFKSLRIGNKNIKLLSKERADIKNVPTMQQLGKFKSIVRSKYSGATDAQLESAFRSLLSSERTGFKVRFPYKKGEFNVETNQTGEIPS